MNNAHLPSLRGRLLIHLWGPLLLVLVFGALGGMNIARHVGYLVHDYWLLDSAMTLGTQVKNKDGYAVVDLPKVATEMFEWDRVDHIYWEAISERSGWLLGNATIPAPPAVSTSAEPQYYDAIINGNLVRIVSVLQAAPAGINDRIHIRVGETMHKREAIARLIFSMWAPLQIVILVLAGTFIWLAVTHNLRKVDNIAARLTDYETDSLIPITDTESAPSEIVPLINALNRLIQKLREEQDLQKQFIANAAHQLSTPLATLQIQTQRVMRERNPVKHDQALADVHRAVIRLHHVTHQMLTLMRSEKQVEPHLRMFPVDLAALAREEVERWSDTALAGEIDLGYDGPESSVMVQGEAHLLRELVGNLIDNAIRYNARGGVVTLILRSNPVTLAVEDDGPGIPERERDQVFERFYRGSAAQSEGCGLGLPIAREIAARHGAQLVIGARSGGHGAHIMVIFRPEGVNVLSV